MSEDCHDSNNIPPEVVGGVRRSAVLKLSNKHDTIENPYRVTPGDQAPDFTEEDLKFLKSLKVGDATS